MDEVIRLNNPLTADQELKEINIVKNEHYFCPSDEHPKNL